MFFVVIFMFIFACSTVAKERINSQWISYSRGSSNIILSAPHGGYEEPSYIEERECGTNERDSFTQETTLLLADEIERITGFRPHLVVNLLHRNRLDANRELEEAVCVPNHHEEQEEAWNAWQDAMAFARETVMAEFGRGIYVDMHGQSHEEEWQEFGYLLSSAELQGNEDLDGLKDETSIRTTGERSPYSNDFDAIVRGNVSLGTMMEERGYKSVPSSTHPHPDGGGYFSGGYNTQEYGSLLGGDICAVQLEMPYYVREVGERAQFVATFASVLLNFMTYHGITPPSHNNSNFIFVY